MSHRENSKGRDKIRHVLLRGYTPSESSDGSEKSSPSGRNKSSNSKKNNNSIADELILHLSEHANGGKTAEEIFNMPMFDGHEFNSSAKTAVNASNNDGLNETLKHDINQKLNEKLAHVQNVTVSSQNRVNSHQSTSIPQHQILSNVQPNWNTASSGNSNYTVQNILHAQQQMQQHPCMNASQLQHPNCIQQHINQAPQYPVYRYANQYPSHNPNWQQLQHPNYNQWQQPSHAYAVNNSYHHNNGGIYNHNLHPQQINQHLVNQSYAYKCALWGNYQRCVTASTNQQHGAHYQGVGQYVQQPGMIPQVMHQHGQLPNQIVHNSSMNHIQQQIGNHVNNSMNHIQQRIASQVTNQPSQQPQPPVRTPGMNHPQVMLQHGQQPNQIIHNMPQHGQQQNQIIHNSSMNCIQQQIGNHSSNASQITNQTGQQPQPPAKTPPLSITCINENLNPAPIPLNPLQDNSQLLEKEIAWLIEESSFLVPIIPENAILFDWAWTFGSSELRWLLFQKFPTLVARLKESQRMSLALFHTKALLLPGTKKETFDQFKTEAREGLNLGYRRSDLLAEILDKVRRFRLRKALEERGEEEDEALEILAVKKLRRKRRRQVTTVGDVGIENLSKDELTKIALDTPEELNEIEEEIAWLCEESLLLLPKQPLPGEKTSKQYTVSVGLLTQAPDVDWTYVMENASQLLKEELSKIRGGVSNRTIQRIVRNSSIHVRIAFTKRRERIANLLTLGGYRRPATKDVLPSHEDLIQCGLLDILKAKLTRRMQLSKKEGEMASSEDLRVACNQRLGDKPVQATKKRKGPRRSLDKKKRSVDPLQRQALDKSPVVKKRKVVDSSPMRDKENALLTQIPPREKDNPLPSLPMTVMHERSIPSQKSPEAQRTNLPTAASSNSSSVESKTAFLADIEKMPSMKKKPESSLPLSSSHESEKSLLFEPVMKPMEKSNLPPRPESSAESDLAFLAETPPTKNTELFVAENSSEKTLLAEPIMTPAEKPSPPRPGSSFESDLAFLAETPPTKNSELVYAENSSEKGLLADSPLPPDCAEQEQLLEPRKTCILTRIEEEIAWLRVECEIETGLKGFDWEYIEQYSTPRLQKDMMNRGVLFSVYPTISGVSKLKAMVRLDDQEVYDAFRDKCRDIRWAIQNGCRRDLRKDNLPELSPAPVKIAGTRVTDVEHACDLVQSARGGGCMAFRVGSFDSADGKDNCKNDQARRLNCSDASKCASQRKSHDELRKDKQPVRGGIHGKQVMDVEFASGNPDRKSSIDGTHRRKKQAPQQRNGHETDTPNIMSFLAHDSRAETDDSKAETDVYEESTVCDESTLTLNSPSFDEKLAGTRRKNGLKTSSSRDLTDSKDEDYDDESAAENTSKDDEIALSVDQNTDDTSSYDSEDEYVEDESEEDDDDDDESFDSISV